MGAILEVILPGGKWIVGGRFAKGVPGGRRKLWTLFSCIRSTLRTQSKNRDKAISAESSILDVDWALHTLL